MHAGNNDSAGYTLSELLVVVAMIGVITLVTLPAFMQLMPQYRIRSAASDTAAAIRLIRQKAMTKRTPHKITFDAVNERYTYYILVDANASMSNANNWLPLTSDARQTADDEAWIRAVSVDLRLNTTNPFNDVDCPADALVDLIFLRDGSVGANPPCGGIAPADNLTFDVHPSIVFAVDNNRVKFNRYYLSLARAGTVAIRATKE